MRAITRYKLGQLVMVTVFVTLGLTFAVWLTQSLRLIDLIVNRGLPATTFLSFIALLLPQFLGIVLPIAAFCAVVFVYNKLISDSELVVLRAAGLSQLQLARPALMLGLGIVVLMYAIMLYFLPASFREFKDLQFKIRNDYSAVLLREGVFNDVSDGVTVYVRERTSDGELKGILVHDTRDGDTPVTMMAERGALVTSDNGPRVVMANGNRQVVNEDSGKLAMLYFDRYTVDLSQFKETLATRWREPKERYLHELLIPQGHSSDLRYRDELVAEAHRRLATPLYAFAFVVVGAAAMLTGEFRRRGNLKRILAAVLIVAVLEIVNLTLHDLSIRMPLIAIPALYAGALIPIGLGFYALLRGPGRKAKQRNAGPNGRDGNAEVAEGMA
jgi:lipopolysaccharide export system permease protein